MVGLHTADWLTFVRALVFELMGSVCTTTRSADKIGLGHSGEIVGYGNLSLVCQVTV